MAEIDRIAKLCFNISHRSLGSGRGRARFPDLAPPIHMGGTKKRRRKLDREQPNQLMIKSRLCSCAAFTGRGVAGNCSTLARWPSHSRVSSTISPSGNSSAS
jgi:hypothetical protein